MSSWICRLYSCTIFGGELLRVLVSYQQCEISIGYTTDELSPLRGSARMYGYLAFDAK